MVSIIRFDSCSRCERSKLSFTSWIMLILEPNSGLFWSVRLMLPPLFGKLSCYVDLSVPSRYLLKSLARAMLPPFELWRIMSNVYFWKHSCLTDISRKSRLNSLIFAFKFTSYRLRYYSYSRATFSTFKSIISVLFFITMSMASLISC